MEQQEILQTFAEVKLNAPGDFLKVKETLERIGIATGNTLYQSCHILHKRSKYYIVHFKEIFALDGRETTISETDIARRNTIVSLLCQWGLVVPCDPQYQSLPQVSSSSIKIIPFRARSQWTLKSKYTIGQKR